MKTEEINRIAFLKGVDPHDKPKWEVICLIQIAEGLTPLAMKTWYIIAYPRSFQTV